MIEKKRKPRLEAPRTEVFAMRLDPKMKYLAEIASRKQRRSIANFIECAMEQALSNVRLVEPELGNKSETVAEAAWKLWALDDAGRLLKLATHFPDLLSYDEQVIWKMICDYSVHDYETNKQIRFKESQIANEDLVRSCWQEIQAYIANTGTKDELNAAILLHYSTSS
jgi:hypothetical protein